MATNPAVEMSPEETIARITELAMARPNANRFLVKVGKRRNASGMFEGIAELTEATAFHISSPEVWLNQLLGGGEYRLKAYHMDAPTLQVGSSLNIVIPGGSFPVPDRAALERPDWVGPRVATFLAGAPTQAPQLFSPQPQNFNTAPQPQWQQPGQSVQQGYGAPVVNVGVPQQAQAGQPQLDAATQAWLRSREQELAQKEARILREQSEKEAELKRIELENKLREENDRKIRELELKFAAQQAQQPKGAGAAELVTALVGALAPLAAQMITTSAQSRADALKTQMEMQERSDRRMEKLVETLGDRGGMSEETKMVIEMLRSQGSANAEQMRTFLDASSIVTKNSMAMIETVSNLKFGDQEEVHPAVQAIREAVMAIRAMSAGAVKPPQQPRLPQQNFQQAATQPVPQQPPPIVPIQGSGAVAQGPQRFDGMAQAPVPQQPQPQPQQQAQQLTVNEARMILQRGQKPGDNDEPLLVLAYGIQAHHNPVEIAHYLFNALKHPKLAGPLAGAGNEPDVLLAQVLGVDWIQAPENVPYMMQLGRTVEDMGVRLGLFEDEEDEQDENEEIPPPAEQVIEAQAQPIPVQGPVPAAVVMFPPNGAKK